MIISLGYEVIQRERIATSFCTEDYLSEGIISFYSLVFAFISLRLVIKCFSYSFVPYYEHSQLFYCSDFMPAQHYHSAASPHKRISQNTATPLNTYYSVHRYLKRHIAAGRVSERRCRRYSLLNCQRRSSIARSIYAILANRREFEFSYAQGLRLLT